MTDEELIARWDCYVESMGSVMGEVEHMAQQMRNRIEALVKERDQWVEHTKNAVWSDSEELKLANDRAERLEAAIDYILDGMAIDAPDYEIDPDYDFLDAANSDWVRDVLTRLAAAMKGADHE